MKKYRLHLPKKRVKPKRVYHPELAKKNLLPYSERNHALVSVEPFGIEYSSASEFSLTQEGVGTSSVTLQNHGIEVCGNNTRSGVANPLWKDQTRLGHNATTAFNGDRWVLSGDLFYSAYAVGTITRNPGGIFKSWAGSESGFLSFLSLPDPSDPPPQVIAPVHNRCIAKFIQEVNAAQSSENLTGRSIKHFKHDVHSTLHPMAGIREKISGYLTSLEKVGYGKLKGASLLDTIGSAYLEFKFGVEPFVADISDIVADMVIRDRKRNPSVPVEATAHTQWSGSVQTFSGPGVTNGLLAQNGFNPTYNIQKTGVYSERIKGAVRTGINDDGRLGLIQDNRLLPKDWAPTIFSILPYAWMVNYFTNISGIIDGASLRFSDVVWACSTTRNQSKATISGLTLANSNPYFVGDTFFTNSVAVETYSSNPTLSFTRVSRFPVTPNSLVPSFEWKIPTTTTPWANMMAAFLPRILKVVF